MLTQQLMCHWECAPVVGTRGTGSSGARRFRKRFEFTYTPETNAVPDNQGKTLRLWHQPWAWVSWLLATIVILSITRNPLYLVLILMCVVFVGITLRQAGAEAASPFSLWKLAAWILLLSTAFNALTSHYGQTVLFTIPGSLLL